MGNGRLGHSRFNREPEIGDLVVCVDLAWSAHSSYPQRFIGLVLNKSITICKIQALESAKILYWPLDAMSLWRAPQSTE